MFVRFMNIFEMLFNIDIIPVAQVTITRIVWKFDISCKSKALMNGKALTPNYETSSYLYC